MQQVHGHGEAEIGDLRHDRASGIAARPRDPDQRALRPRGAWDQRDGTDIRMRQLSRNRKRSDDALAGQGSLVAGRGHRDGEEASDAQIEARRCDLHPDHVGHGHARRRRQRLGCGGRGQRRGGGSARCSPSPRSRRTAARGENTRHHHNSGKYRCSPVARNHATILVLHPPRCLRWARYLVTSGRWCGRHHQESPQG